VNRVYQRIPIYFSIWSWLSLGYSCGLLSRFMVERYTIRGTATSRLRATEFNWPYWNGS